MKLVKKKFDFIGDLKLIHDDPLKIILGGPDPYDSPLQGSEEAKKYITTRY